MKFDARVVGLPNHLAMAKSHLPKQDYAMELAKMQAAEKRLTEKLPTQKREVADFFKRKLDCISHFQCDRFDFLAPLFQFATFVDGTTPEEVIRENAWTGSLNIVLLGTADSMIVPFDFPVPLEVKIDGRAHPYMLCSGVRMKSELNTLDEYVAVEHTLGVRQLDAFVSLSREAMAKFEKAEGVGRRFWAKWGVMALRGLVERALKNRVPVILDPNFGDVPASV